MAGAEFAKFKQHQMAEMQVHFDQEIRGRVNHSNESIDPNLTQDNYYLGANSYEDMLRSMDNKITYADKYHPNQRQSNRRKECFTLEVPCPPELEDTPEEDKFYQLVYDMYSAYLPGIVGGCVHKDEKHDYYDSAKGDMVTSRNHMHIIGACITQDGRCHTSDTINKQMCQRVNDDIQALCLNTWGISYQTGEGRKGKKKTVEELKQQSQIALQQKLAKEGLIVVTEMRVEKKELENTIEDLSMLEQAYTANIQQQENTISANQDTLAKIDNAETIIHRAIKLEKESDKLTTEINIKKESIADLETQAELIRESEAFQRKIEVKSKLKRLSELLTILEKKYEKLENLVHMVLDLFNRKQYETAKLYEAEITKEKKEIETYTQEFDTLQRDIADYDDGEWEYER